MAKERTLIIVKPDGVQRRLAGEIIGRFEKKGFKLVACKFVRVSKDQAEGLYAEHLGKPFYEGLVKYISSSPVVLTVWEAQGVISMARKLMGATFGFDAEPGTIRGDFGSSTSYNLVHGSDKPESAEREIALFFAADEILDYDLGDAEWVFGEQK